jgi:uncharacterized membrane protein
VDFLRGVAVGMMVMFHIVFDLSRFGNHVVRADEGFWWMFARATAALFIFLAGVSLFLKYERLHTGGSARKTIFFSFLFRGVRIFLWGMLITLFTLLVLRDGVVFFGVLHLIGLSTILCFPFVAHRHASLLFGLTVLLSGIVFSGATCKSHLLVWLGCVPAGTYMYDYVPLVPWAGVMLVGVSAGSYLYAGYRRRFTPPDISHIPVVNLLCRAGRHSLLIYFVHQPLIIFLLAATGLIDGTAIPL